MAVAAKERRAIDGQFRNQSIDQITSSGCSTFISVVQSTDFSNLDHCSQLWWLFCSRLRRILGDVLANDKILEDEVEKGIAHG